jgi:hypothetical protein
MKIGQHIKTRQLLMPILLSGLLTACAINDSGTKATALPITLNAPPASLMQGNCDITPELENWLQVTVPMREQFQNRLEEAAAKNAPDVHDDTLYLATLRDAVANTVTPDCGEEVQKLLNGAMAGAVDALQAYYNRTLSGDLNAALEKPREYLAQATALQNDLITRMKKQYQLENANTPTLTK